MERLKQEHPSRPFNPDVARVLFQAGLIETWGRGYEEIMAACAEHGVPGPDLRYEEIGLWVEYALGDHPGTKLGLSRHQAKILRKSKDGRPLADLLKIVGRSNRTKFRDQVLAPLLDAGLMEMTIPHKPRSPNQQYRTTAAGVAAVEDLENE